MKHQWPKTDDAIEIGVEQTCANCKLRRRRVAGARRNSRVWEFFRFGTWVPLIEKKMPVCTGVPK